MTRPYRERKREKSPRLRDKYYHVLYARLNHDMMAEIDAIAKTERVSRAEVGRNLIESALDLRRNGPPWPG